MDCITQPSPRTGKSPTADFVTSSEATRRASRFASYRDKASRWSPRPSAGRCAKLFAVALLFGLAAGCGTTRRSDTARTATEQLLISNAIDRAVARIDLQHLSGKLVFFDDQYLDGIVDRNYVVSSIRQHLLASGAYLKEKREDADYVVEARAGAVGTDRNEVLFGVPAVNIPSVPGAPLGVPSSIPEIALAKKTDQKAVAKIAMFAYNRVTGRPVWQSGITPTESTANDTWFFGAGPFQRGSIRKGTRFAGNNLDELIVGDSTNENNSPGRVPLTAEMVFPESTGAHQADTAGRDDLRRLPPVGLGGQSLFGDSLDTPIRQAQRNAPPALQTGEASAASATGDSRAAVEPKARHRLLSVPSLRNLFGRGDRADGPAR